MFCFAAEKTNVGIHDPGGCSDSRRRFSGRLFLQRTRRCVCERTDRKYRFVGAKFGDGTLGNRSPLSVSPAVLLLGVFAAEWIRSLCERVRVLHWRQVILLAEIVLLVLAGLFPDTMATPANVLLSFACAMQVESFRKFRGIPCATTMCIGNMRSATEHLYHYLRTRDPEQKRRSIHYYVIILVFAVGAALGLCSPSRSDMEPFGWLRSFC